MAEGSLEIYDNLKSLILKTESIDEFLDIDRLYNRSTYIFADERTEEVQKLRQALLVIEDVKSYILRNKINNFTEMHIKAYVMKNDEIICFLSILDKENPEKLKHFRVFGFFGEYDTSTDVPSDYFLMEAGVKFFCRDTPLEIKTINAGNRKRLGIGTLGLRFLEEFVIPEINCILNKNGYKEKIGYIYGISAELSADTPALARAKFYSKNGFQIINSHFYKYI